MKIYLSKINESWIVDRLRAEWYQFNPSISTESIKSADIIWVIAPWIWKKIPKRHLKNKKVICTYYHIDFNKFGENERSNFFELDQYVDEYHAASNITQEQLTKLTNKKINTIPTWVNQNIWFEIKDKTEIRKNFNFEPNEFLVGSFQRDTEGHDLISPKLIKGPDIFVNLISLLYENNKNLKVVLSGTRRNYVLKKLDEMSIPFAYFEMASLENMNKLYNILDLYLVTSRVEGGPQAIMECALTKTPILSTNVGIASEILHKSSIFKVSEFKKAKVNTAYSFQRVQDYIIPNGFEKFIELLKRIYEKN